MRKKGIPQEYLKLIACVTMLLDHIGAVFFPGYGLRIIGRIAFPIYCFLLTEGVTRTRNSGKYAVRLAVGTVLSEIPFDLLFFGGLTWRHQSVMVTLLAGFLMAMCMKCSDRIWIRITLILPFALLAELLSGDYGGWGVVLIGLLALTWDMPYRWIYQLFGSAILFCLMNSTTISIGVLRILIQMFALFAMVPVYFYSGRKLTCNRNPVGILSVLSYTYDGAVWFIDNMMKLPAFVGNFLYYGESNQPSRTAVAGQQALTRQVSPD